MLVHSTKALFQESKDCLLKQLVTQTYSNEFSRKVISFLVFHFTLWFIINNKIIGISNRELLSLNFWFLFNDGLLKNSGVCVSWLDDSSYCSCWTTCLLQMFAWAVCFSSSFITCGSIKKNFVDFDVPALAT